MCLKVAWKGYSRKGCIPKLQITHSCVDACAHQINIQVVHKK